MQAIEFEATTFQHTIRVPDSVPDGVSVRVLLLVDENNPDHQKDSGAHFKSLLQEMPDVGNDQDFARHSGVVAPEAESRRQAALAHIAAVRANWQGKPIADRDALYDNARGN